MTHHIQIKNQVSELNYLHDEINKLLLEIPLGKNIINDVLLAVEEAIINIISYAFKDEFEHNISITINRKANSISASIEDDGIEFNPLLIAEPVDLDSSIEDRKIGGLGIFLIKKLMTEVAYERFDNKNKLTLTRNF